MNTHIIIDPAQSGEAYILKFRLGREIGIKFGHGDMGILNPRKESLQVLRGGSNGN